MVNVGGFFAELKLNVDGKTFKSGIDSLKSFGTGLKQFATIALGVGVALTALLSKTSKLQTEQMQSAWAANTGVQSLKRWQYMMQEANVDSASFTASMIKMNKSFQGLKIGEVDEGFIKALGQLGGFSGKKEADFSKFQGMSQEDRLTAIFKVSASMKDQQQAALLVNKLLGEAGEKFFYYIKNSGRSLSEIETDVRGRMVTTGADNKSGLAVQAEFAKIKVSLDEASMLMMTEFGKALLPVLQDVAKWLKDNTGELKKFASAFGDFFSGLSMLMGNKPTTPEGMVKSYRSRGWQFGGGGAEAEYMAKFLQGIGFSDLYSKKAEDMASKIYLGGNRAYIGGRNELDRAGGPNVASWVSEFLKQEGRAALDFAGYSSQKALPESLLKSVGQFATQEGSIGVGNVDKVRAMVDEYLRNPPAQAKPSTFNQTNNFSGVNPDQVIDKMKANTKSLLDAATSKQQNAGL